MNKLKIRIFYNNIITDTITKFSPFTWIVFNGCNNLEKEFNSTFRYKTKWV